MKNINFSNDLMLMFWHFRFSVFNFKVKFIK